MNCPWYVRWWHRRLRRLDARFIFPALYQAVGMRRPAASLTEIDAYVMRAWELHKELPGQEHWRCLCARRES